MFYMKVNTKTSVSWQNSIQGGRMEQPACPAGRCESEALANPLVITDRKAENFRQNIYKLKIVFLFFIDIWFLFTLFTIHIHCSQLWQIFRKKKNFPFLVNFSPLMFKIVIKILPSVTEDKTGLNDPHWASHTFHINKIITISVVIRSLRWNWRIILDCSSEWI